MPYRLEPGEPVPEGMKRIAREELESAAELLAGADAPSRDEAIHEARKSLKKVRAVLRLLRPEVDAIFPLENRRLRDTGRRLSDLRDATVLIETFDDLRERYRDELGRRSLASIRRELVAARQKQEHAGVARTIGRARAGIRAAAGRSRRWPLRATGFAALAPGLKKTFGKAKRAMKDARRQGRPEDFHEWRKRAKDHWYHVRLLRDLAAGSMAAYEQRLHDLETWLGDDHNLVLLGDHLRACGEARCRPAELVCCFGLIRRRQQELRRRSLAVGKEIYGERPREYVERIGRLSYPPAEPAPAAAVAAADPVAAPAAAADPLAAAPSGSASIAAVAEDTAARDRPDLAPAAAPNPEHGTGTPPGALPGELLPEAEAAWPSPVHVRRREPRTDPHGARKPSGSAPA